MARRRKSSALDDLLDISISIPLWANLLIAAVLFVGLHLYAGGETPTINMTSGNVGEAIVGNIFKVLGYYGQFLLPPVFILGGIIGSFRRKLRSDQFSRISSTQDPGASIRSLTWHEFERMTGEALRRQGYLVEETKKGPDGGVDLVLRMNDELFLVQCKQWKAQRVSVQVVRELYGVMAAQGATGGFVVTSGAFTSEAMKFASGTNIQLIDGKSLASWFRAVGDAAAKPAPTPRCPRCGDVMTPRFARAGGGSLSASKVFLGCTNFPACRGTRQLVSSEANNVAQTDGPESNERRKSS
ncbi:restriction endonuclease [Pseudomonas sp. R5(2019)]|uniref:restriction endonuclease n=1 Tax=Pseudomonas sp. R5(2019) TaxID=2697566 RepID=UPI0014134603|nr:restriction endonuclease [Pseudomonas sp. R5(2019)]NBA95242.1 DUF2034 domain-containing protein [Pseudomonas sp. R5(2019)]